MTSVNWNLSLGQFLKCTRGIVGSHPNISALSSMTGLAQNSILWLIWLILRDSMSHLQIWENSIQYAVLIDCCKSLLNSMTSDLFSMTLEVIWIIFWRLANTSRWSQKLYDRKCQWLFEFFSSDSDLNCHDSERQLFQRRTSLYYDYCHCPQ